MAGAGSSVQTTYLQIAVAKAFDDLLKNGELQPGFLIYKRHLERLQGRLQFGQALA